MYRKLFDRTTIPDIFSAKLLLNEHYEPIDTGSEYRKSLNKDRLVLVVVNKKWFGIPLITTSITTPLLVPKEIDVQYALDFYKERRTTPAPCYKKGFVGYLKWLGACGAEHKKDFLVLEVEEI